MTENLNFLLIEDTVSDAELIKIHLKKLGIEHSITVMDNLKSGLEYLNTHKLDLVLLDMNLPDGNGVELIEAIMDTGIPIPIVVLTGSEDNNLALQSIQKGAQDYLIKGGFTSEVLRKTLFYALERQKLRDEISAGQALFKSIFQHASDMIFLLDANGIIQKINPCVETKLQFSEAEIIGKSISDLLIAESLSKFDSHFSQLLTQGFCLCEITLQSKEMDRITVENSGTLIRDRDNHVLYIVLYMHDVTEQNRIIQHEKEVVDIKSRFVSVVSHELRSPLGAIKGSLDAILDGLVGDINNDQRELLGIAKNSIDRLSKLTTEVLDFQKMELGKMPYTMKNCQISDIIGEAILIYKPLLEQKSLGFKTKLEDNLPLICADHDKLIQVLVNLIGNALKFTKSGHISISAHTRDSNIVVSVTDTGIGMEKSDLEKLFQAFSQVHHSSQFTGSGLGLAIAKEIITAHQGSISVESQVGVGSTFTFTLPILSQTRQEERKKVIIIDDSEDIGIILSRALSDNYSVTVFRNGLDACIRLPVIKPDIILTDIHMPEFNGIELYDSVQDFSDLQTVKFVFMSAHYTDEILAALKKRNETHLLYKPIEKKHLLEMLDRCKWQGGVNLETSKNPQLPRTGA